ncbi:MAG: hypothetical protein F9K45_00025 [Melioribacteraceae bacterium]|nr:MAG: hypothetical protein F9K45_00025 [Melioribacteraceae bacterium]
METPLLQKIDLLKDFDKNTKPLWGKMSPQHMIEHLIGSLQMAIDELKVECFNPPEKLPALKKYLMSSRPLPKDFINPVIGADLIPLKYSSLEESISVLKNYIKKYYDFFETNPDSKTTNPTFGELNKIEWDKFHEKHFNHHFSQFGLVKI